TNPGIQLAGFHANHVGDAVAHLVHDVVGHVAMHSPVTWGVGYELDVARSAGGHQHGGLWPLRRQRHDTAVGSDYLEVVSMQVDRMVIHRTQVAKTDSNAFAELAHERGGAGKCFGVHGQHI